MSQLACSPYLDRPTRTAELADAIVDHTTLAGSVTEADLAARGFTLAEIGRYGGNARRIARARLAPRMVA